METENTISQMERFIRDNSRRVSSMEWDACQINKEKHNFLGTGQTEILVEM
jgi:hypothetical protein